jgi:hypothetical protein
MNMKIVEITEKLYKQEIDPNEAERLLLDLFAVSGSAYGNESKATYLKALDLHYKLSKEQMNLVWKAMDGYGDYRAREAAYDEEHNKQTDL